MVTGKASRLPGNRRVRRCAGRTEDGDFGDVVIGAEDFEGIAQLFQCTIGDLEVAHIRAVLVHLEHGGQHLRVKRAALARDVEPIQQGFDLSIAILRL